MCGRVGRQLAERFRCEADAIDAGQRLLGFRHDGELVDQPLDLHVEQVRRSLQIVDGALRELARLLDLAHGRVEIAERIEPDQSEQAATAAASRLPERLTIAAKSAKRTCDTARASGCSVRQRSINQCSSAVCSASRMPATSDQACRSRSRCVSTSARGSPGAVLPVLFDDHAAQCRKHDHVQRVDDGIGSACDRVSRARLRDAPVLHVEASLRRAGLRAQLGERVPHASAVIVGVAHDLELNLLQPGRALLRFVARGPALHRRAPGGDRQRADEEREHEPGSQRAHRDRLCAVRTALHQ